MERAPFLWAVLASPFSVPFSTEVCQWWDLSPLAPGEEQGGTADVHAFLLGLLTCPMLQREARTVPGLLHLQVPGEEEKGVTDMGCVRSEDSSNVPAQD